TISVPASFAPLIRRLVDEWLRDPDPHQDLTEVVRSTGALPLYRDAGGTVLLSPEGEILSQSSDEPPGSTLTEVERDPKSRLSALVVGTQKYPELAPLLPQRTNRAKDCGACAGRGGVQIGDLEIGNLLRCGQCCGLGWLDEATSRPSRGR